MDDQTDPFQEHAYRESLENEDEANGTPVTMWAGVVTAIIGATLFYWGCVLFANWVKT